MKLEKDYGVFSRYTPAPDKIPPGYEAFDPTSIEFCKNAKGEDFYTAVYRLGAVATGNAFMLIDDGNIVISVVLDKAGTPPGRTQLGSPANRRVLEFSALDGEYIGKEWAGGTNFVSAAPVKLPFTYKLDFWRRCSQEEAAALSADLTEADPQLRELFNAATELHHDVPEYPLLFAAVEKRVGTARANELLAFSDVVIG